MIYVPFAHHGESPRSFLFHRRPLWSSFELRSLRGLATDWNFTNHQINVYIEWVAPSGSNTELNFTSMIESMPALFCVYFLGEACSFLPNQFDPGALKMASRAIWCPWEICDPWFSHELLMLWNQSLGFQDMFPMIFRPLALSWKRGQVQLFHDLLAPWLQNGHFFMESHFDAERWRSESLGWS